MNGKVVLKDFLWFNKIVSVMPKCCVRPCGHSNVRQILLLLSRVANTCVCVCVAHQGPGCRQVGPSDHKTGQDGMYNSAKHNASPTLPPGQSYRERFTLHTVFLFAEHMKHDVTLHSFVYRIGCLLPSPGCSLHRACTFPLFLPLETTPSIFRGAIYMC